MDLLELMELYTSEDECLDDIIIMVHTKSFSVKVEQFDL